MSKDRIDILISRWNRLGTCFAAPASIRTPDLEQLVLHTARNASGDARLFTMAATWLNLYGHYIARHRFKRMIAEKLEPEHWPAMGLLLDTAQRGPNPPMFKKFIERLKPSANRQARPLFDIIRSRPAMFRRAERRASPMSKEWGLWADPIEFKFDAIQPAQWIMDHNPEFIDRARFRGDLRSSIMAALLHDIDAGDSESELAAKAGGSRGQVLKDLDNLYEIGCVRRTRAGNKIRIKLIKPATAA